MKKIFLLSLLSICTTAAFTQLSEKVGIGVRLQLDSTRGYKIPVITNTIPNGAAQDAGLLAGDLILKVNDKATRNMPLPDVVSMITGDEGTNVKIEAERKGVTKSYNIRRGKYKFSASFYEPAVKNNNLCNALVKLMNDAGYEFDNTMDKTKKNKDGHYGSKVTVPGAQNTSIYDGLGSYAQIDLGSFSNKDEVNTVGTEFMGQVKTCFPDYYYEPQVEKSGSISVNIGRLFKNGFESPILQMLTFFDNKDQKHKLHVRVLGGKLTRFYNVEVPATSNSFSNALKTIYNDVPKDFRNVKGKKHGSEGGLFSSGSWYEITPVPDGAKSCSVAEGGMNLGTKNCNCGFYLGTSRNDAVTMYNSLFEKTKAALGTGFVFTTEKSMWDMNITKATESVVSFGKKAKKTYESDVPIIVLLLEKYENNQYGVRMLFYQQGF